MTLQLRPAEPGDADAIADLHAASWRSAYRGMFSDAYLDGDVVAERRRQWAKRLRIEPRPDQGVFVAFEGDACVGFLCLFLESDPAWGPLLDNLHVRPDVKGQGIGRRLLEAGRAWMKGRGAFSQWHLWVLEANVPTRKFYEHLGWIARERAIHAAPDGTPYPAWRYTQSLQG